MTWRLPDTYHSAGTRRGTATLKFYEGRDILVIAIKGNLAFVIDDVTSSTAPVPLVETMARQQYAAL
jgi:hypothetical protein